MQFLKECDVLKIEDILPFFEDVVTIDQFRVRLFLLLTQVSADCLHTNIIHYITSFNATMHNIRL